MDMKLEVVVVPVSDVDRSKNFYEKLGFRQDIDLKVNENFRVVQFTPPGSYTSIHIGKGITSAAPGSLQNAYLIVNDIEEAHADLVRRGVSVSDVFHRGPKGPEPGRAPEPGDYSSFVTFTDPDGNSWLVQEIKKRLPGRANSELLQSEVTGLMLETLKSTAAAHGEHEKQIGKPDPEWPVWYAEHMAQTLADAGFHITRPPAPAK
ncbi:MAG TPA: VOC family protein [Acidobacteriota bacterium]|nr:VOC family protein [Acidobacteriota bacterium]